MYKISHKKKIVVNQHYERYWKLTLGFSDFFDDNFRNTLQLIVRHINKYKLNKQPLSNLKNGKHLNNSVVHQPELVKKIAYMCGDSKKNAGPNTRKRINEFIKLGFIKPFFHGYVPAAKEYIKPNQSRKTLRRLFSDTVYQYGSFNSSQVHDHTSTNNIKFIVNTLLNRKNSNSLTHTELIGLMTMNISNHAYAKDTDIQSHKKYAKVIDFTTRKYNQITYLQEVLEAMLIFHTTEKGKKFVVYNNNSYLTKHHKFSSKRDPYRYELMRDAVYRQSRKYYDGKEECWLTHEPRMKGNLWVSHIYPSGKALSKGDSKSAYDPNNALLLAKEPDGYFDKNDMTINTDGYPIYDKDIVNDLFLKRSKRYNYHIDKKILNKDRLHYLKINHKEVINKHPQLRNKIK